MANNQGGVNKKELFKFYKRFFIVLLCCFPLLAILAFFVVGNLPNIVQILIYCLIVLTIFFIEEWLYKARRERREILKQEALLKKGKK